MRIEFIIGEPMVREVGAAVVRSDGSAVLLELGPADGPPLTRLRLTCDEAGRLQNALRSVVGGRKEEIILADD